jgi:membrane associated rhomboid family serine protease
MVGNGKYNGNGSGNGHDHGDDPGEPPAKKIIRFPTRAERQARKEAERKMGKPPSVHGPLINLPRTTKFLAGSFLLIHAVIAIFCNPEQRYWIYDHFGFMPARYTGAVAFGVTAIVAPFTYMFLHGGWSHVLLNTVMTAAFGAGAERFMGPRRMIVFFVLCSLAAALAQLAVMPFSEAPVVGASGGLSGLFAAIILVMQRMGMGGQGRYGVWPFVILWVGITVLLGSMGGAPGGGNVAWVAHLGGFLAGFVLLKPVMRWVK